jgi:ParB-like chromosome segregation protein Spo0J/mannose-6-phosphate isomerase-like protein (cupin superfamily)
MKVIKSSELSESRVVSCPNGGFVSNRILLNSDNMGYGMTKTVIPVGEKQFWHYKDHLESCYCVSGVGILTNADTGEEFEIKADTTYVLDENDPHYFQAIEEVTLICVFNPPLIGDEVHQEDGSYAVDYRSPVYDVLRVPISKVTANDYNPNSVAPPEMALLETSIWEDGYTQPVVVVYDRENDEYVVIDGFHRFCVLRDSERIREREKGMLPVVVLKKEMHDRMASTIRHNRARGTHNVELMSTIVAELVDMGKGDAWICKHIGMSPDELLRLKQITGVAALFQNQEFSKSWDAENFEEVTSSEIH